MPVSANIIKLLDRVEPGLRDVLITFLEEMEKKVKEAITKDEFNELKTIVRELAEAQKKSEERLTRLEKVVAELAEAQKRSEERLTKAEERLARLEKAVVELIEAQKRSEERLAKLENIVVELTEVQKRSEERLTRLEKAVVELIEAQKRAEERFSKIEERLTRLEKVVAELAEAQKITERELQKLIGEHRKTREMVGSLQHTVGYILEDRAFSGLPPLLKKEGIRVIEPLRRDYIEISPRNFVEVNIIGKGRMNGKNLWIIGDCKTQIKKKDVDEFLKTLKKIEEVLPGEKFPIIVTYQASPLVREYIRERGLTLYFSYQFPL